MKAKMMCWFLYACVMAFGVTACNLDEGQVESPIMAAAATVTTDATNYVVGQPITITWSGLPGNTFDWVEYLPVGGDDHNPTRWVYTAGLPSGSVTLQGAPADGAYVARAFLNDTYTKLAESAGFAVGTVEVPDNCPTLVNGVRRCQDLPPECHTPAPDTQEAGLHCIPGTDPNGVPWVDRPEIPCSCVVISGGDSWCVRLSE